MNREEYISILETDNASYKTKINQLQSNWNSLREWLKENEDKISYMEDVIDKMNELEGREDG